jgi:hypothetical protein
MKKLILFAIIPAIITGIMSFAPKLYDIIKEPKAKLIYDQVVSIPVQYEGGYIRTLRVETENVGKRPLNNLSASIVFKNGVIQTKELSNPIGLKTIEKSDSKVYSVQVESFLPGDYITINAILWAKSKDSMPIFNARTQKIIAQPKEEKLIFSNTEKKSNIMGSFLASGTVFVMVIITVIRRKKGLRLPMPGLSYKEDAIRYIFAKAQIPKDESRQIWESYGTTYINAGDILLSYGLKKDASERKIVIESLKCFLLVKSISRTSQEAIINNIKILERDAFSEENIKELISQSVNVDDVMKFRNKIDDKI